MRRIIALIIAVAATCAPAYAQVVPPNPVALGVSPRLAIVSTSPQTCTNLTSYPAHGVQIVNASAAQTATLAVYDEGNGATCVAADLVYSAILGVNAIVTLGPISMLPGTYPLFLTKGFAYTLSAAATGTISILPF